MAKTARQVIEQQCGYESWQARAHVMIRRPRSCLPSRLQALEDTLKLGCSFTRPATIELECAEQFLEMIPGAEMVKFCKEGSDATSGAVRLARSYTGSDSFRAAPITRFSPLMIGLSAQPRCALASPKPRRT
jgi:hypothetical protein